MPRVLSGMRPTGRLHIGNYKGAAAQFLELQQAGHDCFFFVADLHALTKISGPEEVRAQSIEVVRSYMACGIDPENGFMYRQSDIPEISQMMVLLGNIVTLAQVRRCTTYKGYCDDLIAAELVKREQAEDIDAAAKMIRDGNFGDITLEERYQMSNSCSYGLLGYPVLMACDILGVKADLVPVGADQRQHVEFARDYAGTFNHMFHRPVFTIPSMTDESSITVPGLNGGNKMSKSGDNSIALLDTPKAVRRKVMSMPTQADPVGDRTLATDNLYRMIELFCPSTVADEFLRRWGNPADKYFGHMKGILADQLVALLEPIQQRHATISDDDVRDVLTRGAKHVRPIADAVLQDMHLAMGL